MTWNDLKDTKWCNIQNRLDLTWLDFDLIDKNVKRLKELKGTNGPTNQCSDEPMDQPKDRQSETQPKALHRYRKWKEQGRIHGHQLRTAGQGRKCAFSHFSTRSPLRTDQWTDGQSLLLSCVSATKKKFQWNPALTDFRGLTFFFCYWQW